MADSILYTSSAAENGTHGLIWGEVDYNFSAKYSNTYSRLTFTWLGECWQGKSQYEGTTETYLTGTISVTANGKTFSGTISGYRSHTITSSNWEWSASNAKLGYVDIARGTSSKSVTISLSYTYEGNSYTGSTTVTVPALPTYTIKYAANGGSGTTTSQTKTYGTALTLRSALTRTGYTFSKWKATDGTLYSAGGSYTKNEETTLTAQWTAKTYEVKYNANGGTSSTVPSTQTKTHGKTLTLSSTKPTRTGYTFSKWNTKSDGSGTNYSPGGSYTTNADTTLYAQWTICKKTFVFNANSGTGTMSNQIISYANSGTTALTSNTFTRSGYTFSKWNTKDDGTGTNYSNGASITRSSITSNSTINLYAQWAVAFVAPKINSLKAVRSNDNNAVATITVELTKGSNAGTIINTTYIKIQYKKHSATDWSDATNYTSTTGTNYTTTLSGLEDVQYDIQAIIYSDGHSDTAISKTAFISSAFYTIDINKDGTGIGFFRSVSDTETGIYIGNNITFFGQPSLIMAETAYYDAQKENGDFKARFGCASANGRHGIYSSSSADGISSKWIIMRDQTGDIFVGGNTAAYKLAAWVNAYGTDDGWTWRKYSDGTFDAWGTFTVTPTSSTASGNIYYSNSVSVNFPFTITSGTGIATGSVGSQYAWLVNTSVGTATVSFRIARGAAISTSTTLSVRLHVFGDY